MIDYRNTSAIEMLKSLDDKSVRCVITDPPYNIGFHGKYDPDTNWDSQEQNDFEKFMLEWMLEAKRVLTDDGSIWMCFAPTQIELIESIIEKAGLINHLDHWKIIARPKGRGASKKLKSLREDIFCLTKKSDFYFSRNEWITKAVNPYKKEGRPRGWKLNAATSFRERWDGFDSEVLHFSFPYYLSKSEKMIHSCQKPLMLWMMLICNSSEEGDLVIDPFAGSFSSGIAARALNRNYIGSEIDKNMYEKAIDWRDNGKPLEDYLFEEGFKFGGKAIKRGK